MRVKVTEKDRGWKKFFEQSKLINGSKVKVGVLASSTKGGLHEAGQALTLAEIAAVLEWGTRDGKIAPRPALIPTFDKERDALAKMGKKLISAILMGKMDTKKALGIMGAYLANATKRYITDSPLPGINPPNRPAYARYKLTKGSGGRKYKDVGDGKVIEKGSKQEVDAQQLVRTWVDTGRLVNAFTWAVEMAQRNKR